MANGAVISMNNDSNNTENGDDDVIGLNKISTLINETTNEN